MALFRESDSYCRFEMKATAHAPEHRFQSAEDMAEQLLGVLHEVSTVVQERRPPFVSFVFAPPDRVHGIALDWRSLPTVLGRDDTEDQLRIARALIETHQWPEVDITLDGLDATAQLDWRVSWHRGLASLAQDDVASARAWRSNSAMSRRPADSMTWYLARSPGLAQPRSVCPVASWQPDGVRGHWPRTTECHRDRAPTSTLASRVRIPFGSAFVMVRVLGDPPIINLFSAVVEGIALDSRVLEELNQRNLGARFVRFVAIGDTVIASYDLFGRPFVPRISSTP